MWRRSRGEHEGSAGKSSKGTQARGGVRHRTRGRHGAALFSSLLCCAVLCFLRSSALLGSARAFVLCSSLVSASRGGPSRRRGWGDWPTMSAAQEGGTHERQARRRAEATASGDTRQRRAKKRLTDDFK